MPPKILLPNFPLRLRLNPTPFLRPRTKMPEPGTEGTFKTDVLTFDTVQNLTKIEIKRFLESVYGLNIEEVRSLNRMGRRRGMKTIMPKQGKDIKRFYVRLSSEVELPNIPKMEVLKKAPS